MAEIGYATLGIIPSFDGFERKLQSGTSSGMAQAGTAGGTKFGDAAGKSAGSRFGSLFKSAAKASLIGLAGAGALAFKLGKDSVSAASDLEESTNKVAQVFGKNADSIFKFTETTADKLGQSNVAARDAAATFGIFGKSAELSDRKNAKFSKRMTRLASDLASFHNTEPEEAVQALGSALRGEAEPMRAYGVLLDEAALKAEALRLGLLEPVKDKAKIQSYQVAIMEGQKNYNEAVKEFGKGSLEALKAEANLGTARDRLKKATEGTIPPLTQQQKVLAASSAIFKQTEVAQGDFARTSDGLANQQRRLKARFEDAKAELGQGLLPIMTDAADFLLDKGLPAFEKFSGWFTDEGVPAIKDFARENLPEIKKALGTVKDVAGDVAPILKGMFDGFNDLPDGLKKAIVIGAGAGVLGKKFGLLGGGARGGGLVGSAINTIKPIKVFETNPAALGGPGGGDGGGPKGLLGKAPLALIGTAAIATAAAAAVGYGATRGIFKLQETVAPKAYDKGIVGTPHGGPGSVLASDQEGVILGFNETKEKVDELVDSTNRFKGALDLVGAKKVNPDLRIPNILQEQDRLASFVDKMDLVGSKKIRPGVEIRGIEQARADLRALEDQMNAVAAFDPTGITGLAAAGVSGLRRERRRNLGGYN